MMSDKWMMNSKVIERKRSWPNFKVLSPHSSGGIEENHEQPQSVWQYVLIYTSCFGIMAPCECKLHFRCFGDVIITVFKAKTIVSHFNEVHVLGRSRVSLASVVSDYGLDGRAIGIRSPAWAKAFSSVLCVQTGSGGPPSLLSNGYAWVLSPGAKRGRGVTLTTRPHLVLRSWMSRSYISSPPKRLNGV
jgi:hypothetical protein